MAVPVSSTSNAASCATDGPVRAEIQPGHRDANSENFPVASFLLPRRIRSHVLAFYRFARAADDIADSTDLSPSEKVAALDRLADVLDGATPSDAAGAAAAAHRASLKATGVSDRHGRDLLQAFRRDAANPRCADWDDLMAYCRISAASVGRYLIDLNGEDPSAYAASDALCAALQVLNHLQDLQDDLLALDRVYLPLDWVAEEGAVIDDLRRGTLTPAMRRVVDRCLDATDLLLAEAASLPGALGRSRLRYEAAVILTVAERLSRKLRDNDPLASRVALSRSARLCCLAQGLARAVAAR
jgi:hydroxysqualene synthase